MLSCTEGEAKWRSSISPYIMQGVLGLGVGKAAELGDSVKKAYAQVQSSISSLQAYNRAH